MARQDGLVLESNFIRGLITEKTDLNSEPNFAVDTLNCVYNEKGYVTRRLGIDLDDGYSEDNITSETDEAHTQYLWDSVRGSPSKAFLVVQQGSFLYFYDVTSAINPPARKSFSVNLEAYRINSSVVPPAQAVCQFAQSNGVLLVVNPYSAPFYVEYNASGDTITVNAYMLRERDFVGEDDGFELTYRPRGTGSAVTNQYPKHMYNLYNQGWYEEAINAWDTASSRMPSNADAVGYFRKSTEDLFSTDSIRFNDPGSSPAPKGSLIYDVGSEDRRTAIAYLGLNFTTITGNGYFGIGDGTPIGSTGISNLSNAFNNASEAAATCATVNGTSIYVGKDFGSGVRVSRFNIYPSSDAGFTDIGAATELQISVYASHTSPAGVGTAGTLINRITVSDSTSPTTSIIPNTGTPYRYWWLLVEAVAGTSGNWYISEIDFGTTTPGVACPSTVAFFAGRAWYSGLNDTSRGSRLYFSQVLEDDKKLAYCYQTNDPASDKFADLLATDGGVINIPDVNSVVRLFNFQNKLLVLATNGVWVVSGGDGGVFAATSYRVNRISSTGCFSPQSVVDVKGLPVWWGEDGIYTVQYDANYDSVVLKSLSEDTIKTFFLEINSVARQFATGTYDKLNDTCIWVYGTASGFVYTKALCLNVKTGAFYPWSLSPSVGTQQSIRGVIYVQDGERELGGSVKYPITYTRSTQYRYAFCSVWKSTYKDYAVYNVLVNNAATTGEDYSSYVYTGYRLDTKAIPHLQSPYVYTYMSNEASAGVYLQGIFDFTGSGTSGKWSTPQQAYNALTTLGRQYHDTKVSRLKIRGTGKAMRLYYYSETGKPFTLLGWGIWVSGNTTV